MNEADTSNNETVIEPLNSANSPQSEQASCPFYSVVLPDNMAVNNLPLLQPSPEPPYDPISIELSDHSTQPDWVAEPDRDKQVQMNSEFQQLLALNQELRADNSSLYQQVEQLKTDLTESEKFLQWQKTRFSVTESMFNQQNQELAAAQEQIQSLFQELESAVQNVQNQDLLIKTYQAQLQISQQRLALLERECTLLQSNYSEQSQQLMQSESTCRELRTRLMRQQRQTLQFKAALEKCLDTSVPNQDIAEDSEPHSQDAANKQSTFSRRVKSLFPNAQPIKPWSAESESFSDYPDASTRESSPPLSKINNFVSESLSVENSSELVDLTTPLVFSSEGDDSPPTPIDGKDSGSNNLDQQIDSLIQMFFVSQPASPTSSPPPPVPENPDRSNHLENSIWETLATTIEDHQESEILPVEPSETLSNPTVSNSSFSSSDSNTILLESDSPLSSIVINTKKDSLETEDYWLESTPSIQAESSANFGSESFK